MPEAESRPPRPASLDRGRLSLKWSVGQLARLYLLSNDDFVADTACFEALQGEKGKRRATLRTSVVSGFSRATVDVVSGVAGPMRETALC